MNKLFNIPSALGVSGGGSSGGSKPSRPPPPRQRTPSQGSTSPSVPHQHSTTASTGTADTDDMVVIEDTVVTGNSGSSTTAKDTAGHSITDEEFDSISFSSSYCGEWERLFAHPHFRHNLHKYGMTGKLRSSRFRSVCWKVYLGVLPDILGDWVATTRESRRKYTVLRDKLIVNPHKVTDGKPLTLSNPLSQEEESPWNQYFQDNELRVTIKQDVIRTFPEVQFFQDIDLHERMVNILFIVSRQYEHSSYRQGMHELLAPLIFVLHCDHQAFLHACEIESVGEVVKEVLNPEYIEHDAYALFCQIMATVEPWYVSKEVSPPCRSAKDVASGIPFARPQDMNPSNVIICKLTRIQDYLMKKYDPELQEHLERMEIPPQIYGIRWVRLLFGREFPMQDLLVLWDAIFADSISFDLVDYVFLAMMLYLRDALLTSDYPTCLSFLMKYPPVGDIHYFIDKALYLREPNQHPCPANYTYQKPANYCSGGYGNGFGGNGFPSEVRGSKVAAANAAREREKGNMAEKASAGIMTGWSTLTRKLSTQNRPRTLMHFPSSPKKLSKSNSQPITLMTDESPSPDLWRSWLPTASARRKGSTASMSQIEDSITPHPAVLRPTSSSANLNKAESPAVNQAPSPAHHHHPPASPALSASDYYGRRSNRHVKTKVPRDTAILMGRLNDMETMCQRCADKMDIHIDKLQNTVLGQEMDGEDELLLALAGLKQVRDVLKGILKPGAILDREEIHIEDNHYSLSPRQPPGHDDDTTKFYTGSASVTAATTPTAGSDLSSDTDLTSPEYDPAFDFSQRGQGQVDPGATFDGHQVTYGGTASSGSEKSPQHQYYHGENSGGGGGGTTPLLPKPDIELKDFNSTGRDRRRSGGSDGGD